MAASNELPIPDYDQLSLADLRHRIRSLEEGPLRQLFDHENGHGNRIPVLEVLHALKELHEGAEPSGGDQSNAPGAASTPAGSSVQEATAAEASTPLRHGVASQTPSRGKP
ncbi:hypothetical protein CQY20_26375 [Mycolicibacterium agri]|uniref:DUF8129 domain-containing protein n=1 Tax=Mycolicibacterium agri TaxID=36811 RepID=A0A2A7MS09_MYCAG|nr:hypothetical protein [Mycolicibacterium agri]PEG34283.1 hypothetical protein CQY20_26375 [Mycolicibacterium agri]GFG53146.1 hypothetical protein MAGR_45870 [Mycolicibacterium agri]